MRTGKVRASSARLASVSCSENEPTTRRSAMSLAHRRMPGRYRAMACVQSASRKSSAVSTPPFHAGSASGNAASGATVAASKRTCRPARTTWLPAPSLGRTITAPS